MAGGRLHAWCPKHKQHEHILDLTIDYGPFGFLDAFDPSYTPNTTDIPGRRYCFAKPTRHRLVEYCSTYYEFAAANLINKEEASKIASTYGDVFSAEIIDPEQCNDLKMGSYLAVAAAFSNLPPFIHLGYRPPIGDIKRKLAIVGKGLTFDSGGYNIKAGIGSLIELTNFDLGDSAATLRTTNAIQREELIVQAMAMRWKNDEEDMAHLSLLDLGMRSFSRAEYCYISSHIA